MCELDMQSVRIPIVCGREPSDGKITCPTSTPSQILLLFSDDVLMVPARPELCGQLIRAN